MHGLEWLARQGGAAVIALFSELPAPEPPFDRILYGAADLGFERTVGKMAPDHPPDEPVLLPVVGRPHPLSDAERRLAGAIARDRELAGLFGFNQRVRTVRGSHPCVDLLWSAGRVVVELDGHDHNSREKFAADRHRDYELAISGYLVLRVPNEEVIVDLPRTLEKIRDMVRLRGTNL